MKLKSKIVMGTMAVALSVAGAFLAIAASDLSLKPEIMRSKAFSSAERAVLQSLAQSTNPIRIGHIPDTPPIDFGESGSPRKGLTWDYVGLLEQKLGISFERVDTDDWEKDLRAGNIDLVGSIQWTPKRARQFQFSKSYWQIQMLILARKDSSQALSLNNMTGMRVAVVRDTAVHNDLQRKQKEDPADYGYVLVPVEDAPQGMQRLADGDVEAMVADGAASRYYMPTLDLDLRVAGKTDYAWNMCFACNTNSPLPAELLDTAIDMVTKEEKLAIKQQWPTLLNTAEAEKKLSLKVVGLILVITLLAVSAVLLWNRTLRKQLTDHLLELGRIRTSHAQATRALDESEERFRVLVESSSDIIWEMDRYGTYTYVSPQVHNILGYSPEELIGKSSLSLMPPPDSAKKMEQLRTHTPDSTIDCEQCAYFHKDGKPVILESSGMGYTDNTGQLAGFRGVSRNITERIANENALRNSEERFRNLVETTSDWIWEMDTQGRYTYLSPRSSELLGYEPDELLGKHFTTLMPDPEARKMKLVFEKLCESGKPIHSMVNTNLHRNNQAVMLEMSAVPFYDKEWNIQGYRGISRDISDRVAVEKQLEFERNLFHSFMEHAPDLIYFKDAEGHFIEVNTAKAEELRRPAEEIIGKTDFDFLPPDQAQRKFEDELEVMRTRKPLQKEEVSTTPDGDRWYLTTKVPRYGKDGSVIGTFGTSWDITYRKQAGEQLRQLRALMSNTINSMPSILIGVDASGRVIQWNQQAETASGLAADEAMGLHLRNAFPEMAKEMVKVERAIREKKPQLEERIRFETGGHVRYHDVTVFPLKGETEGAVIRVDDVTGRVIIEDSIRNIVEGVSSVGRRFFGSMVNQLCKTLDADFTFISEFVDESQTKLRTIAVSENGEFGPNFEYEISTSPCDRVICNNQCTYMAKVHEQYPNNDLLQDKGIENYIGIPLQDSENNILGVMVAMYRQPVEEVDFATSIMQVFAGRTAAELERLQATKELIGLQKLLENIISSMPSTLIGVDANRRVMQWNREAEKMSGIEASWAYGRPLERLLPDLGIDMVLLLDDLLSKGPQHHERIRCTIKGDQRIVDVSVYPITTDGSEGAVIRLDDITDRVRIDEMMVQSEKMMSVGGLAAGMAHEINNPLAGILQNLQVIRNRIMHNSKRNLEAAEEAGVQLSSIQDYMKRRDLLKMLESTAEAGHRAAKIVDNMLSFSRKDESHFAPHNLEDIIERGIELASNDYNLKKRFDFRHIHIVRDYGKLDLVHCEASQIQQVILNLLTNSAQAMANREGKAPDPQISIRLEREGKMALIEVEDNGPGMDPETCRRAFEPFFTTKEVGQGTGLGLSVSYFIITENHGGTMHLDSMRGHGARFSIRIPFEHQTSLWGLRL